MLTGTELFECSAEATSLDFCVWGWMKSEVYRRNVDTWDVLLARILDVAAGIKKRED
jgi:hypothetical protein